MEQTDDRNLFQNYSGQSTYEDYLNDIEIRELALARIVHNLDRAL